MVRMHPQVRIAKGFNRAIFCDLQREIFYYIRPEIADWMECNLPCDQFLLEQKINTYYKDSTEFINWLFVNEIIFNLPDTMLSHFPDISLDLYVPGSAYSASVHGNRVDTQLVIDLCSIGVRHLVVDCAGMHIPSILTAIEQIPQTVPLGSVVLWVDQKHSLNFLRDLDLVKAHPCIVDIILYDDILSVISASFQLDQDTTIDHWIKSNLRCSIQQYIASRLYNTSFHMHLHVSETGDIYESIHGSKPIGSLEATNNRAHLLMALARRKFDVARKDDTLICRDCEFRYICSDPREPVSIGSLWTHKSECAYNPYISKWKGEEGYRTLAECGVVSNEVGFDHDRIATINQELWGE